MLLALSIVHRYTVSPCVADSETGGRKLHAFPVPDCPPEVGVVDEVDASHLTAPYCAVKVVVLNGTTLPSPSGFSVNEAVGSVVKPVVWHPENVPLAQKFVFSVGVTVLESVKYCAVGALK